MTRTRVKICGITRPEDALAASEAGADAIGLVFFPGSKRHVTGEQARLIRNCVPPSVTVVGVFVDATTQQVQDAVAAVGIDVAQLCGTLPTGDWSRVAKATRLLRGLSVIGATIQGERVDSVFQDYLIDNGAGGTGTAFDWNLAQGVSGWGRIWLAGGLNSANVREAMQAVRPHAVDVSTGVESAPGIKSAKLIREFIDAVHHADHALAKLSH